MQAVFVARFYGQTKQRRIRWVSRERAYRHRIHSVEPVVLDDHRGAWFPRVILSTRDSPDLTALHSSRPQSEIASMKS